MATLVRMSNRPELNVDARMEFGHVHEDTRVIACAVAAARLHQLRIPRELGLGHGPKGLMAAHYHPTDQQCVDKAAIADVAAQRRLPISQLNWCQANVQSAAR